MSAEEHYIARLTCALGAGSGLIIIPLACLSRARVFQKRVDINSDNVSHLFEKFLLFKAALDIILCLTLLVGLFIRRDSIGCRILGFIYQYEEVMTLGLIIRFTYHPFSFMLKKEDMTHTKQYFNRSVIFCFLIATLVCVPLAAVSDFGRTGTLCWMRSVPVQFYAFFSLVIFAWILSLTIIFRLARVARHRYESRSQTVYHGTFFKRITSGLVKNLTFIAFSAIIYTYIFRLSSRAYLLLNGRESMPLAFLEMFTIAFRGPIDAFVYAPKDWLLSTQTTLARCCGFTRRRGGREIKAAEHSPFTPVNTNNEQEIITSAAGERKKNSIRLTLLGKAYPLPFFTDPPPCRLEDRKIFVSTYNLAECKMKVLGPEALAAWIPRGMDLYVLSLQECMVYGPLAEAILQHVGGAEKYVIYRRAIGSTNQALGYHGLIALIILARVEEVRANRFLIHESKTSAVARGKNLGITTTENKGACSIAWRYYDTTFAMMSCHLASDLKGRSRLHKRNQDAWQLIYETNLWREEYLLDVQHQHFATIFCGDLNYRLRRSNAEEVLEDVAAICRRERDEHCGGATEWRQQRYEAILNAARKTETEGEVGGGEEGEVESGASPPALLPLQASPKSGPTQSPPRQEAGGEEQGEEEEEEEQDYDEDSDDASEGPTNRPPPTMLPLRLSLIKQVKSYLSEVPSPSEMARLRLNHLSSYSHITKEGEEDDEMSNEGADAEGGDEEDDDDEVQVQQMEEKQLQSLERRSSLGGRLLISLQHVGRRASTSRSLMQIKGLKDADREDIEMGKAKGKQQRRPKLGSKISRQHSVVAEALDGSTTNTNTTSTIFKTKSLGGNVTAGTNSGSSSTNDAPSLARPTSSTPAFSWSELLQHDELRKGMANGEIFYGFQEGDIRFPPSYRRIKGVHGKCGDYTDAEVLKNAYSIAVKEKASLGALTRGFTKQPKSKSTVPGGGTSRPSSPKFTKFIWSSKTPKGQVSVMEHEDSTPSQPPRGRGGGGGGGGGETYANRSFTRTGTGTSSKETTTAGGGGGGGGMGGKTTTRIPSYTDRILLHVVEDYLERIKMGPYEMCDALTGSDHRPVSSVLTAQVNVAIRGLNCFQQAKSFFQDPGVFGGRDVLTVHDACFYMLEIFDMRVEFLATGLDKDGWKGVQETSVSGNVTTTPRKDASVFVLFPLDNEDSFSTLRRPAVVASVAKQIAFLTEKIEYNPFNFYSLTNYGAAVKNGVTMISCTRMDFGGLHASFSLRDDDSGQLGACVISLTDKDRKVVPFRKEALFPLTVGGCLCGYLRASIRITQLALDGNTVQV